MVVDIENILNSIRGGEYLNVFRVNILNRTTYHRSADGDNMVVDWGVMRFSVGMLEKGLAGRPQRQMIRRPRESLITRSKM